MATQLRFPNSRLRNKWVLVTGASSGLGRELAWQLATDYGANLVVVARRSEALERLRDGIQEISPVEVVVHAADLIDSSQVDQLIEFTTSTRPVDAAALNAGVTYYGHILDQEPESLQRLLRLNVISTLALSQALAKQMVSNRSGSLLFVSSLAGTAPLPGQAVYAATKSLLSSYCFSLAREIAPFGVSVTVGTPGGIATEMLSKSGLDTKFKATDSAIMPAKECARQLLVAFDKQKAQCTPGFLNRLLCVLAGSLPPRVSAWVMQRVYASERTGLNASS